MRVWQVNFSFCKNPEVMPRWFSNSRPSLRMQLPLKATGFFQYYLMVSSAWTSKTFRNEHVLVKDQQKTFGEFPSKVEQTFSHVIFFSPHETDLYLSAFSLQTKGSQRLRKSISICLLCSLCQSCLCVWWAHSRCYAGQDKTSSWLGCLQIFRNAAPSCKKVRIFYNVTVWKYCFSPPLTSLITASLTLVHTH